MAAGKRKPANVLGLEFEIPEELREILAMEMKQKSEGGKSNSD